MARAKMWGIRMYHEASLHERNCFLTLTYANAPEVLDKRDLQLFIKRLRHLAPVRYFACGEYGTLSHRAHFHAVIFGEDFLGGSFKINDTLYSSPTVSDAWRHGIVSIGSATIESMMYVAGYCNKKAGDPETFNMMSRRPGIGHTWLEKYGDDIRNLGKVVVEGREYSVPKKYLEWHEGLQKLKLDRKRFYEALTPEEVWSRRIKGRDREKNYKGKLSIRSETI